MGHSPTYQQQPHRGKYIQRMKPQLTLILLAFLLGPATTHAQKLVDRRDQATGWYVPVNMRITANGGDAKTVNVQVYKDNALVNEMRASKDKFTLNLDLENTYTVILNKEGYRTKSVYINTHVPEKRVEYPSYDCKMDLEPVDRFTHADPFFMDFPSAIVRWDDKAMGFMPQMGYITDIQAKMAMLRAQMDPR